MEQISKAGGEATLLTVDIGDPDQAVGVVDKTVAKSTLPGSPAFVEAIAGVTNRP